MTQYSVYSTAGGTHGSGITCRSLMVFNSWLLGCVMAAYFMSVMRVIQKTWIYIRKAASWIFECQYYKKSIVCVPPSIETLPILTAPKLLVFFIVSSLFFGFA